MSALTIAALVGGGLCVSALVALLFGAMASLVPDEPGR